MGIDLYMHIAQLGLNRGYGPVKRAVANLPINDTRCTFSIGLFRKGMSEILGCRLFIHTVSTACFAPADSSALISYKFYH